MSFSVYTRTVKSNRSLLRNKDKYKRLKDNAYDRLESKISLHYTQPSESELKEIRKSIFEDIRREQKHRRVVTYVALICGLVVALWVIYAFQYKIL